MGRTEQGGQKWILMSGIALLCAVAVFIAAFFILNHIREEYVKYTPDQVTEKMIAEMKLSDLVKVDRSQISKHYDIPDGVTSDCSLYMSKSSESPSELACFLLSSPSKYQDLEASVTAHINAKAAGFKSLNPTQYNELKNFLIVRSGRYVLVAVDNNTEAEEKWFRSLLA